MDLETVDQQLENIIKQRNIDVDMLIQNVDRLPVYTQPQIERLLTTLPYEMQRVESEITALEIMLDDVEIKCKRIESEFKIKSIAKKQAKELLSENDRTAWVNTQPEVQEAQDKVIQVKGMLSAKKVVFNRYERNFVAVRKLASLINNTETNMGVSQKYV